MSTCQPFTLLNSDLTVMVIPEEGGRVASLRCAESCLEFLTQTNHPSAVRGPSFDNRFQDGACAGIEECVPTVGSCGEQTEGGSAPDHGDFWQIPWEVTHADKTRLCLEAIGFSRPLRYHKELSLEGRRLIIRSRITNIATAGVSFLYACHPLLAIESGDRVVLPHEVSSLQLYYSRAAEIGVPPLTVPWPGSASQPLDIVRSAETGFAAMLYTRRLQQGSCGLYRSSRRQGLTVRFDPQLLPFLGLWLCYGGWPDETQGERQHAVALEPTVAPCNTLQEAQLARAAKQLKPNETMEWEIEFDVSPLGISLRDFESLQRTD